MEGYLKIDPKEVRSVSVNQETDELKNLEIVDVLDRGLFRKSVKTCIVKNNSDGTRTILKVLAPECPCAENVYHLTGIIGNKNPLVPSKIFSTWAIVDFEKRKMKSVARIAFSYDDNDATQELFYDLSSKQEKGTFEKNFSLIIDKLVNNKEEIWVKV